LLGPDGQTLDSAAFGNEPGSVLFDARQVRSTDRVFRSPRMLGRSRHHARPRSTRVRSHAIPCSTACSSHISRLLIRSLLGCSCRHSGATVTQHQAYICRSRSMRARPQEADRRVSGAMLSRYPTVTEGAMRRYSAVRSRCVSMPRPGPPSKAFQNASRWLYGRRLRSPSSQPDWGRGRGPDGPLSPPLSLLRRCAFGAGRLRVRLHFSANGEGALARQYFASTK
jgi:hypothetical protein